jgi:hypothetical protein
LEIIVNLNESQLGELANKIRAVGSSPAPEPSAKPVQKPRGPKSKGKNATVSDIWSAVASGRIDDEQGNALNPKWTTTQDFVDRRMKASSNQSKAKIGNNNRWKNKDNFRRPLGY